MLWLLAIAVGLAAGPSQAAPIFQAAQILRVGVADGSQPCSYRERGSWSGMAVELWQQVADQEQIPYVLVPAANTSELLPAPSATNWTLRSAASPSHQNASVKPASACLFRNRAWG